MQYFYSMYCYCLCMLEMSALSFSRCYRKQRKCGFVFKNYILTYDDDVGCFLILVLMANTDAFLRSFTLSLGYSTAPHNSSIWIHSLTSSVISFVVVFSFLDSNPQKQYVLAKNYSLRWFLRPCIRPRYHCIA